MQLQTEHFPKIKARTAVEISRRIDLSPAARAYLLDSLSPQGFLSLLVDNQHFADAVRFMAFALPPREGVWWSCVTGRSIASAMNEKAEPCFAAAERWVYEPLEEHRYACLAAAETAAFEGAGSYAALGAFWAGESLAPPDLPPVPPDASLSPTGVGASVLLAVASDDPKRSQRNFAQAIERAADIANGGNGRIAEARP